MDELTCDEYDELLEDEGVIFASEELIANELREVREQMKTYDLLRAKELRLSLTLGILRGKVVPNPTTKRDRIESEVIEFLTDADGKSYPRPQIAEAIPTTVTTKGDLNYLSKVLREMVEDEQIKRSGDGPKTRYFISNNGHGNQDA